MDPREVGRLLRERREALGLSLQDVQQATKIRLRYLEALEEGTLASLVPPVYARGYVRTYAAYLGLDGHELARAYAAEPAPPMPAPAPLPAPPDALPAPPEPTWRPRARARRSRRLSWAVLALLVAALAYAALALSRSLAPPPPSPAPPTAPASPPAPPPVPSPAPPPTAPAASPAPAVQVSTDPEGRIVYRLSRGPLEVTFLATGRCWLRVTADGAPVFEGTLTPGQQRTFRAQRELAVRAGNPAGIQVVVAGQNLGAPDRQGPRTLVFRAEGP